MFDGVFKLEEVLYSRVGHDEALMTPKSKTHCKRLSVVLQLVYFICTLSVGISIGYTSAGFPTVDEHGLLGMYSLPNFSTKLKLSGPSGALLKTFHYNQTFSLPPNPTTNDAWDSLFPRKPSNSKVQSIAS